MIVVWRTTARNDLRTIISYISDRNVRAAEDLRSRIENCSERIADHPYIYRPERIAGTREAVVHPNYVLVYQVGEAVVEILNVIHSRRQYPPEAG